ncbi:MAG: magnesium chelatase [Alphaproteobacteria bacterium PA2]|nr:MAG: magnesium chelatase [Alphaproteobacteria bacterium PA2]
MLTALIAGGHVLLEGPPGTAKTFLAQCFAHTLTLDFGRVQFTPDLMPADIVGANLFNFQTSAFTFNPGPVFCELLLADEINRTPPKTQAALLEAMQERRVTLDGKSHPLSDRFMVVATQNPLEQQGTYPLPEAQLDRFLFKQVLQYPSREEERAIIASHGLRSGQADPAAMGVEKVADAAWIRAAADTVAQVRLSDEIVDYVLNLVRATRESADLQSGASPRGAAMLALAARARAVLDGRDYAIPDDVKALALAGLRHRVILSPAAEIEGRQVDQVLASLVDQIEAPR